MLKAVAGNLLILGLAFDNITEFKAHLEDSFVRISGAETGLPWDVIVKSGEHPMRATAIEQPSGINIFVIGLGQEELDVFHQKPGRSMIYIKKETFGIPFDIMIYSGETVEKMTDQIADLIGPQTRTTVSHRLMN